MNDIINVFNRKLKIIDDSLKIKHITEKEISVSIIIGEKEFEIKLKHGEFFLNDFTFHIIWYDRMPWDFIELDSERFPGQYEAIKEFEQEEDEEEKREIEKAIEPMFFYISNHLSLSEITKKFEEIANVIVLLCDEIKKQREIDKAKSIEFNLPKVINNLSKKYNFHYCEFPDDGNFDSIVEPIYIGNTLYWMLIYFEVGDSNGAFSIEIQRNQGILDINIDINSKWSDIENEIPKKHEKYVETIKTFFENATELIRDVNLARTLYNKIESQQKPARLYSPSRSRSPSRQKN